MQCNVYKIYSLQKIQQKLTKNQARRDKNALIKRPGHGGIETWSAHGNYFAYK